MGKLVVEDRIGWFHLPHAPCIVNNCTFTFRHREVCNANSGVAKRPPKIIETFD
jgi:hypothetical protein